MHRDPVIAQTRAWVDRAVIGLNLCPFARAPQAKGLVRYVVSDATDPASLLACLIDSSTAWSRRQARASRPRC